ncbi:hypothetical protein [Flexivirga caeni]|nr:hypothetical protein [Flexivirga caeni]
MVVSFLSAASAAFPESAGRMPPDIEEDVSVSQQVGGVSGL